MTPREVSVNDARRVQRTPYYSGAPTRLDLAHTVVLQAERITELEQRLSAGVAQAEVARGAGTSIVMALTGDPGAVVEADPYGRSADA